MSRTFFKRSGYTFHVLPEDSEDEHVNMIVKMIVKMIKKFIAPSFIPRQRK